LEKIDLRPSIHLPFDQLELGDLSFGLTVRPRFDDRGTDGAFVLCDAVGERRYEACTGVDDPWIEFGRDLPPDHRPEHVDQVARLHQHRHAGLNGGNRHRVG
jgi:hypothetical protein